MLLYSHRAVLSILYSNLQRKEIPDGKCGGGVFSQEAMPKHTHTHTKKKKNRFYAYK